MRKGIIEFKVGDVDRGFKFGTYAFAIASKEEGCSLSELFKRIGIPYEVTLEDKTTETRRDEVNIMTLLNVFYGAAVQYAEQQTKTKPNFTVADVSDWIDELGLAKTQEILMEGLGQYQPKNSTSLAETGEPITA